MSRMLTAGSNDPTPMNRRNPQGEIFQLLPHPQEYAVPPRGLYGRFQLTGISDTFELVSAQYGPSTKVRLEFLIVKVSDAASKYLEGKRFTELYTWTVGPKSNLGQLFGALRGKPIQPGEDVDPDDYIDTSFVTSTTLQISADGQKQYPGISRDAIAPDKTVLSRHLDAPKQPALVPAGGVDDDIEDPFPTVDDDL